MLFRPSKAYQWSNCAASPRIAAERPDDSETNDAAREGTCAAWVAEVVLTGDAHECRDLVGRSHANGWLVTEEMADDVQGYVDMIRKRGGNTRAEHYVALSMHPHIAGTMDATSDTTRNDGLLYVDDFKYGRRVVEIYQNPQLIIYGSARARAFMPGTIRMVQLGVYQPRAFHRDGIYRKWVLSVDELEKLAVDLIDKARACLDPNAPATPGSWCSHCAGAPVCEALAHTSYAMIDTMQRHAFRERTGIELAYDLDFIDSAEAILSSFSKAIRAEATQRLDREYVPGWSIMPRKGNRRFTVDGATIKMLTGIEPYMAPTLCTPAELERRGAQPEVLEKITERPVSAKLTRMTENTIAGYFRDKGE